MMIAFDLSASSQPGPVAPGTSSSRAPWAVTPFEVCAHEQPLAQCDVRWPVRQVVPVAVTLGEIDHAWGRAHDRIEALIVAASLDDEPAITAAASRARRSLLRDAQASQRSPRRKVSYGRVLVCLARQRPLSFDATLVGLDDALAALEEATEALAAHVEGDSERPQPRRRAVPESGMQLRLDAPTNDNDAQPPKQSVMSRLARFAFGV